MLLVPSTGSDIKATDASGALMVLQPQARVQTEWGWSTCFCRLGLNSLVSMDKYGFVMLRHHAIRCPFWSLFFARTPFSKYG